MKRTLLGGLALCGLAFAQRPEFLRIPQGSLGAVRFERPFWAGRTEVTVDQFAAFVKATGYRTTAEREKSAETWRAPGFRVSGKQPVVHVTVGDAAAYCESIGARLPTDAEWEYAARAGASTWHYWGDAMDGRYLWYRVNSGGHPHAVGRKLPNRWGLHDVEGNVWEWSIPAADKGGPVANRRGGSWVDCEYILAAPGYKPPAGRPETPLIGLTKSYKVPATSAHIRYDAVGFRCFRSDR